MSHVDASLSSHEERIKNLELNYTSIQQKLRAREDKSLKTQLRLQKEELDQLRDEVKSKNQIIHSLFSQHTEKKVSGKSAEALLANLIDDEIEEDPEVQLPIRTFSTESKFVDFFENETTRRDDTTTIKEEEEHYTDRKFFLSHDTFSYIMIARFKLGRSILPVVLAFFVLWIQTVAYSLIIWNVLTSEDKNPYSVWGFPPRVDTSVRVAELLALMVAIASEEDMITAINLWNDGYKYCNFVTPDGRKVSKVNWNMSVYTRFAEGFAGLFVTFILIMKSENVVDLLLNFSAISFVSKLDDLGFQLSVLGVLGPYSKDVAELVSQTYYTKKDEMSFMKTASQMFRNDDDSVNGGFKTLKKNIKNCAKEFRKVVMSLGLFLILNLLFMFGWGYIIYQQEWGLYQCNTIFVQLSDSVRHELAGLSGHYRYDFKTRAYYKIDTPSNAHGNAQFQYCDDIEAWTLWYPTDLESTHTDDDNDEPCTNFNLRSSRIDGAEVNIMETANANWFVRNSEGMEIIMDYIFLSCSDCNRKDYCGDNRYCDSQTGTCKCASESACDLFTPCTNLVSVFDPSVVESDPLTSDSSSYGLDDWPDGFSILEARNVGRLEVNAQPVYFNSSAIASSSSSSDNFDLIIFTGRRWILASSQFMVDFMAKFEESEAVVTKNQLIQYLREEFDPFHSNYTLSFISSPVDVDPKADSAKAPVGLSWYKQNGANTHAKKVNFQYEEVATTLLRCAGCNSETNSCLYQGECKGDGSCDCSNSGASGALCEFPPLGNGHCDEMFNRAEFDFDGGDCCQASCVSSDEYKCGWDQTNSSGQGDYFIGYCSCSDPRYTSCSTGVAGEDNENDNGNSDSCWLLNSKTISGENEEAQLGASISMSADARVLAIGEPGINSVRVFQNDGSEWIPFGETLQGEINSGFGESISISGDGMILAIGSPYLGIEISDAALGNNDGNSYPNSGHISVFKISDSNIGNGPLTWEKIFETSTRLDSEAGVAEFIRSYKGASYLGSSFALNHDGTVLVIGVPMVGYGSSSSPFSTFGGIRSFEWDERTSSYVYQSDTFELVDEELIFLNQNIDDYNMKSGSLSISSSGRLVAFEKRVERTSETLSFIDVWQYDQQTQPEETNRSFVGGDGTWRKLRPSIQGRHGVISGNGEILVVSLEQESRGELKQECQAYVRIHEDNDWAERGEAVNGRCKALSFDGLTLVIVEGDDEVSDQIYSSARIHSYHWNGIHWNHQGYVNAGRGGGGAQVALSSDGGIYNESILTVGLPFDPIYYSTEGERGGVDQRGQTYVYRLQNNVSPGSDEVAKCNKA